MKNPPKQSNSAIGIELVGDLKKCNQALFKSYTSEKLQQKISQLIKKHKLTELGSYYYKFTPITKKCGVAGITGVVALSESHVAFHTWPEEQYVSVSVYVCNYTRNNTQKAQDLFTDIANLFKPLKTTVHKVIRKMK